MPQYFVVDGSRVAHQTVDGEVIAIDFQTGAYFSMRETAADIWDLLCSGESLEGVIADYVERTAGCADKVNREISTFVTSALDANLLTRAWERQESVGRLLHIRAAYSAPVLERFEDMAELIKLDPVHEVSELGWPHRP